MAGYYTIYFFYAPKIITTPTLIGKTVTDTLSTLSELNLNPRVLTEKVEEDLPAGTIINQNPLPGKPIKPNQSVFLVISTKPSALLAPSLVGKSGMDIEHLLEKQNVTFNYYSLPSSYPKNHCIGQSPLPETPLEQKKMIYYLSSGSIKPVIMPNLKNKSVTQVTDFLHRHGMVCKIFHTYQQPDNHQCTQCIVLDQRPLPGSLLQLSEEKPLCIQLQAQ